MLVSTLLVTPPSISVLPAALPAAQVGAAYSQTVSASGGTAPYRFFQVTSGALPAGLTLSIGGVLSGTPTAGGSFTFTVQTTDSSTGSGPYTGSREVAKAEQRLQALPGETQSRVTLLQADGESAVEAVGGRRFAAVLCHGVLGYLEQPEPLVKQLCQCTAAGGAVSIMAGNAKTMAVRPALERRWDDALAAFDTTAEVGVLGVPTRADTVEHLSELLEGQGVEPLHWYGVWLFTDWLEFSGAELDPSNSEQVAAAALVELEASRRDPYRQLSRVFHLVGRKTRG